MRVLVISCVWRRPQITERFYDALDAMAAASKSVEIFDVLIAGSEGDTSRVPAERRGYCYLERPNRPLSDKWQYLLDVARHLQWDYLLMLGSDNLVTPSIVDAIYAPQFAARVPCLGLRDLWIYAPPRCYYWPGYGPERTDSIGAGRAYSRELVSRARWRLWEPGRETDIDASTTRILARYGAPPEMILAQAAYPGQYLIDWKSDESVTSLDGFRDLEERLLPAEIAALVGA